MQFTKMQNEIYRSFVATLSTQSSQAINLALTAFAAIFIWLLITFYYRSQTIFTPIYQPLALKMVHLL